MCSGGRCRSSASEEVTASSSLATAFCCAFAPLPATTACYTARTAADQDSSHQDVQIGSKRSALGVQHSPHHIDQMLWRSAWPHRAERSVLAAGPRGGGSVGTRSKEDSGGGGGRHLLRTSRGILIREFSTTFPLSSRPMALQPPLQEHRPGAQLRSRSSGAADRCTARRQPRLRAPTSTPIGRCLRGNFPERPVATAAPAPNRPPGVG